MAYCAILFKYKLGLLRTLKFGIWLLAWGLLLLKLFATAVSIGSGAPGGVFAPSLFLGALLGVDYGQIISYLLPVSVSQPAMYAISEYCWYQSLRSSSLKSLISPSTLSPSSDRRSCAGRGSRSLPHGISWKSSFSAHAARGTGRQIPWPGI